MTKPLLTALLIAGLSATAKAEPTVYFCNTTQYTQLTKEKVRRFKSHPFKLFVDLEAGRVKVTGEHVIGVNISDDLDLGNVRKWPNVEIDFGEGAFFANDGDWLVDFRRGNLAVTGISSISDNGSEFLISGYIATCDKF